MILSEDYVKSTIVVNIPARLQLRRVRNPQAHGRCVAGGAVLVVHGGIGAGDWTLEDVEEYERPLGDEQLYLSCQA